MLKYKMKLDQILMLVIVFLLGYCMCQTLYDNVEGYCTCVRNNEPNSQPAQQIHIDEDINDCTEEHPYAALNVMRDADSGWRCSDDPDINPVPPPWSSEPAGPPITPHTLTTSFLTPDVGTPDVGCVCEIPYTTGSSTEINFTTSTCENPIATMLYEDLGYSCCGAMDGGGVSSGGMCVGN